MARIRDNDRREFLKRMSASICAGGAAALVPQLELMAATAAKATPQGGGPGYRALVCLYLGGGSDSFNLLMPHDSPNAGSAYSRYLTSRGGGVVYNPNGATQAERESLAFGFDQMLPISPVGSPASSYGLHQECADRPYSFGSFNGVTPGLQTLFGQGRVACIANVGPLVAKMSKTQYNNNSVPKPPQLYSHNDQTNLWFLGRTDSAFPLGWGGQVASRITITSNGNPALSPCISIAGSNRFQIGESAVGAPISPYQMSTSGATDLANYGTSGAGTSRRAALDALLADTVLYNSPYSDEYRDVTKRALQLAIDINSTSTGLNSANGRVFTPYQNSGSTFDPNTNQYPSARVSVPGVATPQSNSLLDQLRMVARMIKLSKSAGGGIGADKQIYYVSIGGFDTHGDAANPQMAPNQQPLLMARVSQALGWFWQALSEIGAQDEVTLFTMSEFGRTLNANGNGTDHAWGGVQLAMGGAVQGQRIYGRYPQLNLNANDDVNFDWSFSRGQYIPTTSMDQMAATLARWMGVPEGELSTIFPNLPNFAATPGVISSALLGFLPAS